MPMPEIILALLNTPNEHKQQNRATLCARYSITRRYLYVPHQELSCGSR